MSCINCKGSGFKDSVKYKGASECVDCGFLASLSATNTKSNIILPDDPMDSFACESCQ